MHSIVYALYGTDKDWIIEKKTDKFCILAWYVSWPNSIVTSGFEILNADHAAKTTGKKNELVPQTTVTMIEVSWWWQICSEFRLWIKKEINRGSVLRVSSALTQKNKLLQVCNKPKKNNVYW
jgi:hypothetical protein